MRALLVAGQTPGLIFPLVPLGWALRGAGHEVVVAAPENALPTVLGTGLPAAACAPAVEMKDVMRVDRAGRPLAPPRDEIGGLAFGGGGLARLAARCLDGFLAFAGQWRPHVIVSSASTYAGPLVAAGLRLPHVRQAVDLGSPPVLDRAAAEELAPELARMGLPGLPEPAVFLDTCPPSLRRADAPPGRHVRYIPFNSPGELPGWLLAGRDRPRVCLTLGSRVIRGKTGGLEDLARLVELLSRLDVAVVVAATEQMAAELAPLPDGVHAGWLPMDVLAPTCDLVVHHGGGNTMLSCLAAGVAQLVIPYMTVCRDPARRLAESGAARILEPGEDTAENVLSAAKALLADPAYRDRAGALAAEIAAQPSPAAMVGAIEPLVVPA
jgi:UDP:flavonoid glycosyltransferase YjiC (YdhE family)